MTPTLAQHVHDIMYDKLVRGHLQPGQRLSNRKIAKELGTSLVPVREAINRLACEGLVVHRPTLGAFVVQPDKQELIELYDLREALECHAAATFAALPIREEDIQEMRSHNDLLRKIIDQTATEGADLLDGERNEQWVVHDVAFHMTLLRAAGNRRTIKTVGDLRVMTSIFGYRRTDRARQRLECTCAEHEKIIAALVRRDVEGSRVAMMEHIRNGCASVLRAFDRSRAEEAAVKREMTPLIHNLERNRAQ